MIKEAVLSKKEREDFLMTFYPSDCVLSLLQTSSQDLVRHLRSSYFFMSVISRKACKWMNRLVSG